MLPPVIFRSAPTGQARLRRSLRAGALIRVGHDTYLEPHDADLPVWERRRAEVLARCTSMQARAGDTFVASHMTAALIHGLWVPSSIRIHVTQAHSRVSTPQRADPVIRHRRRLTGHDVVVVGGLRVTSLHRTVVDCIGMLPPGWALAVADSALRLATGADRRNREATRELAGQPLSRWKTLLEERGPRRGIRQARAVLDVTDPLSESPGESRARAVLLAAGLPVPTLQIGVQVGRREYWADAGWLIAPRRYLLVEFDGALKYRLDGLTGSALAGALAQEKQREDGIRGLGHLVERVVETDLSTARHRAALVRRVSAKLPPRLLQGIRPRPGLFLGPGE